MDKFSKDELREMTLTMMEAQQEALEIQQLKRMQIGPPSPMGTYRPWLGQRIAFSPVSSFVMRVFEGIALGAIAIRLWWF